MSQGTEDTHVTNDNEEDKWVGPSRVFAARGHRLLLVQEYLLASMSQGAEDGHVTHITEGGTHWQDTTRQWDESLQLHGILVLNEAIMLLASTGGNFERMLL